MAFYGLFLVTGLYSQTCDIALTGYTPPPSGEGLHTFTINWTNTENCGCNEFTQWDGNNCNESTSTHVNNNESISHIVFGIHYVNEELDGGEIIKQAEVPIHETDTVDELTKRIQREEYRILPEVINSL